MHGMQVAASTEARYLLRDLLGAVRTVPLRTMVRIPPTQEPRPREFFLELQDGTTTLEAKNTDDLVAQLCDRYPDSEYERTRHGARDPDAERRWADAMDSLIRLLAERVVEGSDEKFRAKRCHACG